MPLLQKPSLLLAAIQDRALVAFINQNKAAFDIVLDGLNQTLPLLSSNLLFNPGETENGKKDTRVVDILTDHDISSIEFMKVLPNTLPSLMLSLVKTTITNLPKILEKQHDKASLPYQDFSTLGVALLAEKEVCTALIDLLPALQLTGTTLANEHSKLLSTIVKIATESESLRDYKFESEPLTELLHGALQLPETTDLATSTIQFASDAARHHPALLNALFLPAAIPSSLRSLQRSESKDSKTEVPSNAAVIMMVQSTLPLITSDTVDTCKKTLSSLTTLLDTLIKSDDTQQQFAITLDKILPDIPPKTLSKALPLLEPLLDMATLQDEAINPQIIEIVHLLTALDGEPVNRQESNGEKINANNRNMHVQNAFLELLKNENAQTKLAYYLGNDANFEKFSGALDGLLNDDAYVQGMLGAKGKNSFLKRASINGKEIASLFKDPNTKKIQPTLKAYQEWSKALTDPTRDPYAFSNLCKEAFYHKEVRALVCKVGKGLFFFNLKECFVGFAIKAFFDQPFHNKLSDATLNANDPDTLLDLAKHLKEKSGPFDEWPSMHHAIEECNFYGLQLRKIKFKNMKIDGFTFNHTRLTNCKWKNSTITNCQFTGMRWESGTETKNITMDIPSFVSLITALNSEKNSNITVEKLQSIVDGITLVHNGKFYKAQDTATLENTADGQTKTSLFDAIMKKCTPTYPERPLEGITAHTKMQGQPLKPSTPTAQSITQTQQL